MERVDIIIFALDDQVTAFVPIARANQCIADSCTVIPPDAVLRNGNQPIVIAVNVVNVLISKRIGDLAGGIDSYKEIGDIKLIATAQLHWQNCEAFMKTNIIVFTNNNVVVRCNGGTALVNHQQGAALFLSNKSAILGEIIGQYIFHGNRQLPVRVDVAVNTTFPLSIVRIGIIPGTLHGCSRHTVTVIFYIIISGVNQLFAIIGINTVFAIFLYKDRAIGKAHIIRLYCGDLLCCQCGCTQRQAQYQCQHDG